MDHQDFEYIRTLVRSKCGISLEEHKKYLVESRLETVVRNAGLNSIRELIAQIRVKQDKQLIAAVLEEMTTNETFFFRDVKPFDLLKKDLLPQLIEERALSKSIRIWCAACSSGQEPYSIAMLIHEAFPQLHDWDIQLIATDLSDSILEKAQKGVYSDFEMNRGLPQRLKKYFTRTPQGSWKVNDEIRNYISFYSNNLVGHWNPQIVTADIVFMRNVLIYFENHVKSKILTKVRQILKPDGFLILGQSETVNGLDSPFSQSNYYAASCYQLTHAMSGHNVRP